LAAVSTFPGLVPLHRYPQAGAGAVLGTIPPREFRRDMSVSADGSSLSLTNFGSISLHAIGV
jgi:hypothetical protein